MHWKYLLPTLLTFGTQALGSIETPGNCTRNNGVCEWYGAAPDCGGYPSMVATSDDEIWYLTATTEKKDQTGLVKAGTIPQECADIYGKKCETGYKRLWCDYGRSYTGWAKRG